MIVFPCFPMFDHTGILNYCILFIYVILDNIKKHYTKPLIMTTAL